MEYSLAFLCGTRRFSLGTLKGSLGIPVRTAALEGPHEKAEI